MVMSAVELCCIQKQAGRTFIFEHPRSAKSWEVVPGLKNLLNSVDVFESVLDMCAYGMMATDDRGQPGLVRKTARLITNSEEMVDATQHRCVGGHAHVHLLSGRAKKADEYPVKLCQAILKGLEIKQRRIELDRNGGMICDFARPDVCWVRLVICCPELLLEADLSRRVIERCFSILNVPFYTAMQKEIYT